MLPPSILNYFNNNISYTERYELNVMLGLSVNISLNDKTIRPSFWKKY